VDASNRLLRWLCWALVVLTIVSALFTVFFTFGIVVPPPPPETGDFLTQLEANRLGDQAIFPYVFVESLATLGVFLLAAMLGAALRPRARSVSLRDVMTVLFVVGGSVGVIANAVRIAASNAASFGYCDCGFKTEELIAQDYALTIGFMAFTWLSLVAISLVAIGVAVAGRIIEVSSAWRTLSYVIAIVALLAVGVRVIAAFVFIEAFDPFQVSDLLTALAAGILVPIWAIMLARGNTDAEPEPVAL
jgi:hypothetical protein